MGEAKSLKQYLRDYKVGKLTDHVYHAEISRLYDLLAVTQNAEPYI